jgi:hypothetical protein
MKKKTYEKPVLVKAAALPKATAATSISLDQN